MTQSISNVACPHCNAPNKGGAAFCAACGKALPLGSASPRVVESGGVASTAAGQKVQSEALQKTMKKASGALLAVAILQAVFGTIILAITSQNPNLRIEPMAYVMIYGIAVAFMGLWAWARFQPLPAAIVGLVLFVTVHALDAVADPRQLAQGIVVKIIVIVILAQAIGAGVQYNKLKQQSQM